MTRIIDKDLDQSLIEETLNGNADAFRPIVEKYWNLVYSIIQRYFKTREMIEDLCQEVFFIAYSRLNQYRKEYRFSPWLAKIAINKSIEVLRKEQRSVNIDVDLDYLSSDALSPETFFDRKQFFDDCIDRLPPQLQILFILRHGVEFSYDEISQILDLPIGTVKGAMHRIRNQLKEHLKKESARCSEHAFIQQELD